jgi:hypothetical protein
MQEAACGMRSVAEIAASYLSGKLGLFDAARQLEPHINPRATLWQALKGSHGPLTAIYAVSDVAERWGYFVSEEVRWEPKAFQSRQTQLAEAELQLAPAFRKACEAIVDYAKNSN